MAKKKDHKSLRVIMIGAHPDDCELKAGATAALWADQGAAVEFLSLSNGDAGHQEIGGAPLARRRRAEAERSARILGVSSQILSFHDGELTHRLEVRWEVIRAIRNWRADIVITHRPNDYHPDHRYTSQAVQDSAYLVLIPNICADVPPLKVNPVFLYFADSFKKPNPFTPDVIVDATPAMDRKMKSLDTMDSQMYEWLPWVEGRLAELPKSKKGRMKWLHDFWEDHLTRSASEYKELLAERYGAKRAARVIYAESFELCEYGRQPSREELWKMFPK